MASPATGDCLVEERHLHVVLQVDRQRACIGKVAHESRAAVDRVIKRILNGDNVRRGGIDPYRCRHCGFWHIGGHGKEWVKRRKMRKEKERPLLTYAELDQ